MQKLGWKPKVKNDTIQSQEEGPSAKEKKAKRFLELQCSIESTAAKVMRMSEKEHSAASKGVSKHAQDIVNRKETMSNEIESMINDWREMNSLHEAEANKKKSKFTRVELDSQHDILKKLNREIQSVNNEKVVGFGGVVGTGVSFLGFSNHLDDPAVSDEERRELNAIKEKDSQFDEKLDLIGNLLSNLNVLADGQNEELKRQEKTYEEVDKKITETGHNMGRVRRKMENTLSKC